MKILKIDDIWSVSYDRENNNKPVSIFRYGKFYSEWNALSHVPLAMFYALLKNQGIK